MPLLIFSIISYIIDNYHHLPDYMLFIHAQRYQWHNDDPLYDGVNMLRDLQIPYLEREGYVNLRCTRSPGCSQEIRPWEDTDSGDPLLQSPGSYYKDAYMDLFPGKLVPRKVGVSCCAQFSVTRVRILERRRTEYENYRSWILDTPLNDAMCGRVFEYSWHSELPCYAHH